MNKKYQLASMKILSAILGLLVLLILFNTNLYNAFRKKIVPIDSDFYTELNREEIASEEALPDIYVSRKLRVETIISATYPKQIYTKETNIIKINYRVVRQVLKINRKTDIFPAPTEMVDLNKIPFYMKKIEIGLNCAGLEVKPDDIKTIDITTNIPANFTWTVSSSEAGTHNCVITNNYTFSHKGSADITIYNNGDNVNQKDKSNIELEIKVLNVWGMTNLQSEIATKILALIGFLFTLPFLSGAVKKIWKTLTHKNF